MRNSSTSLKVLLGNQSYMYLYEVHIVVGVPKYYSVLNGIYLTRGMNNIHGEMETITTLRRGLEFYTGEGGSNVIR